MFDSLKISDLPERQCGVLREHTSTRPTVWVIEENGIRAIVKDFSTNRFFFRNIFGRYLIWREAKVYKRIKGLKGVPELYRVLGGLALVIQEVPGMDLEKAENEKKLPDDFFDALKSVVKDFHKRGVAHCDLKRAANIIIGNDGNPYVIDWATAIFKSEYRIPPLNFVYRRFILDDYNAIIKRKLRVCPEQVTREERKRYNHRSWFEKVIRVFRDKLRGLLQKVA